MKVKKEFLIEMYRTMVRIRAFENKVKDLFLRKEVRGPPMFPRGRKPLRQEGA